jgi:hypothetical protein
VAQGRTTAKRVISPSADADRGSGPKESTVSDDLTDVLVAGYPSVDTATMDFDALVDQVRSKQVRLAAVILVAHDADGEVTVQKAGDHLGRTGAKWGGRLIVDRAYEDKAPYAFTGTVKQFVFDLHPIAHQDEQALHEHSALHTVAAGVAG